MTIVEFILKEFRDEAPATRRVLERIPGDKLSWRPHPKSRSLATTFGAGDWRASVGNAPPRTGAKLGGTQQPRVKSRNKRRGLGEVAVDTVARETPNIFAMFSASP